MEVGLEDAGWGERRVEVLFRGQVSRKRGKSSEAVVEGTDVRIVGEDSLVVAEGKDGLHHLIEEEVCHRKLRAGNPVVVAELLGKLGKKSDGFGYGSLLLVWLEAHGHKGHHVVLADALHLDDSTSLLSV